MKSSIARLSTAAAVLGCLSGSGASAQSAVWVVGPPGTPGIDFVVIQAAVDASADGDVILIKDDGGFGYGGFDVSSKSLSLVAEEGATVTIGQPVGIFDLGPNQSVVLRGLDIPNAGGPTGGLVAFFCRNNEGPIWIEDCYLKGGDLGPFAFINADESVFLDKSASVTFVRCTIPGPSLSLPTEAVESTDSGLALYDCLVQGTKGRDAPSVAGNTDGGPAVLLQGGVCLLYTSPSPRDQRGSRMPSSA